MLKHNETFRAELGKGLEELRKELELEYLNSKEYEENKRNGISKVSLFSANQVQKRSGIIRNNYIKVINGDQHYTSHMLDRTIDAILEPFDNGKSDWGKDAANAIINSIRSYIEKNRG